MPERSCEKCGFIQFDRAVVKQAIGEKGRENSME